MRQLVHFFFRRFQRMETKDAQDACEQEQVHQKHMELLEREMEAERRIRRLEGVTQVFSRRNNP